MGVFLAALFTQAIDLKCVTGGFIVITSADIQLQAIHFWGKEFYRTSAFGADHMVMAAAVVLMLKASDSVVESNFAGEAALGQKLQGSVDRRESNSRIFFLNQAVQLTSRKMFARFQEGLQDGIALLGMLQANFLEVLMEDLLSFPHHLPGDARLVIDPFLKRWHL